MPRRSVLLAVLFALLPGLPASADLSAARRADLKNMLEEDCGSCHGLTRKGGLGSPLTPEIIAERTDAHLREVILDGIPGTPMPPWRPLLSGADVDWLVHLLREGPSHAR